MDEKEMTIYALSKFLNTKYEIIKKYNMMKLYS